MLFPRRSYSKRSAPRRRRPHFDVLEDRLVPATFTVTTPLDVVNANDGQLSLREAIGAANANLGADTIVLPAGVYRLALPGADNTNAAGDLDVTGTTLFQGAGADATVVDGQQLDRVFDVLGTAAGSIQVTFQSLTIRNGLGDVGGGGGIRVGNADLVVQDCAITGNRTAGDGGGISNAALPGTGNVTLVRSTIDRNVALEGGGLSVQANGQNQGSVLTVSGSTILRNRASDGGGIKATTANLTGSTVSGNSASQNGGGIDAGTATLTNSTVSGNSTAGDGGGIEATTVNLTNSTVSGNSATNNSGGIDAITANLTNSTVNGNSTGGDGGGIEARTVNLTDSTVSGNTASQNGGGIDATTVTLVRSTVSDNSAGGNGGAMDTNVATLTNSTVSGNHAGGDGGGIFAGTANLTNSTVSGNSAANGGGISANTTLTGSTVSGNHATGNGGGIDAGVATLTNSTVTGNTADTGGGIHASNASLTNSTVSGNTAGDGGGGIHATTATLTNSTVSGNSGGGNGGGILATTLTLLNVTVTDNSGHTGGGVFLPPGGTTTIRNSIIAENLVDLGGVNPDVSGAFTSGGHNLIGDGTGGTGFTNGTNGDMVGTPVNPIDPRLAPLADNGGPTQTHALLAGSPAINAGFNIAGQATDQRGLPRLVGAVTDIGAVEFQNIDVGVSTSAPAGTVRAGLPATFTLTVINLGPSPAQGITLTDTLPAGTVVVAASGSFTVRGNVVTFAVPDLAAGASTAFTLTVVPTAPGPFTATAVLSAPDDPNLANNRAAASVAVLPRPFPATGSADVTALVRVVRQGRRGPQKRLLFRITNISGMQLQGPLGLVVAGLRPRQGPRLLNASGRSASRQQFVRVDVGSDNLFDPGESAMVQLVFAQPFNPRRLRVLAGAFA